jgi:predicted GTPase
MESSSKTSHTLQKTMRRSGAYSKLEIYILVMGLTGSGKSTFISIATEDDTIPIGEQDDMDGGTLQANIRL